MEEKDKKMKKSELFHEIKKVYQIQILWSLLSLFNVNKR